MGNIYISVGGPRIEDELDGHEPHIIVRVAETSPCYKEIKTPQGVL